MSALNVNNLKFEEKKLFVPTLEEVKNVLEECLKLNFNDVCVDIIDCPNLTKAPYNLVDGGLGGSPTLLEVGGPPFLCPLVDRTKIYDIKEITKKCIEKSDANIFAMGAGAGPFPLRNSNCEGIFNVKFGCDGKTTNGSYTAKVKGIEEDCCLEKIPENNTTCALLLNLFVCEGKPGKVLRVHCKKRIGSYNFIECMRIGLEKKYKEKCVGMGGVFLLKSGAAKQHVMRDFSTTPLNTEEEVNEWLAFYDMPAQLNAVGTFVTHENDLDLRLQHFHSFSDGKWGGHYHYDTTPDVVEYEGYFNVGEKVVRVDSPAHTHNLGRV